jgi:hypothetical protein
MPTLKRQLDLQSISSGGRNLRIDFNMLQIVAVMAALFFCNLQKVERPLQGTHAA